MITSETASSVERKLLVFTLPARPGRPLRHLLADEMTYLFEQIDGWYGFGDRFTVGQLLDPQFRYPGGADLCGWFDHNALWQLPAWPADGSLPQVLTETLEGWIEGAFGSLGYSHDNLAAVVTVGVPVHPASSGICRCGHDAAEHHSACTRLVVDGTLECGCLTWREPEAAA